MYNFISTFDELNKLYEEVESAKLAEAAEDEVAEEEIPVEEIPAEEPVVEDEPRQVICECDKCGALVIKDEADIVVDEETDLVNVEDECKFCEEKEGYKIVGSVVPYEAAIVEPMEEGLFDKFKKTMPWSKLKDTYVVKTVSAKEVKKGDLLLDTGFEEDGPNDDSDFERVSKVTNDKYDDGSPAIEIFSGDGSSVNDPDDKCMIAVPKVTEDIADWYRKKFDKPASIRTQQAWEDELNGEMGEISDERRKQLEKKFQQQRDWEARHEADKK